MKSLMLGIALGCLLIAGFMISMRPTEANVVYTVEAREYSVELPNGTEMKVLVGDTSVSLSYIMPDDTALAYTKTVASPIGAHSLPLTGSYNGAAGKSVIDVEIVSAVEGEAVVKIGTGSRATTYTIPEDSANRMAGPGGACSNPSLTGVCDQVHSNRDWWACFRCCVVFMCSH